MTNNKIQIDKETLDSILKLVLETRKTIMPLVKNYKNTEAIKAFNDLERKIKLGYFQNNI
jgi:hypothetical protein